MDTGSRKWGTPYLTRSFFSLINETMADQTLLILARRNGRYIAGALNFIGSDTLYGRNWGAIEHHPFLHFELCYYQAIDFAIARGLKTVEAGAQGEHKLARGYLPVRTYSSHWIAHAGLRDAVARYLREERQAIAEQIEVLADHSPFRKSDC
jgi:predicted N-acyltransferase